jgi:hypothetical protein
MNISTRLSQLLLLASFVLLLPINAHAAGGYKVVYTYDAAGCRISRKVIYDPLMMVMKPQDDSEQPKPATENMGDRVIKIFPNPTHGDLSVEISGANPKEELRIQLYNTQGAVLENKQVTEGSNPVDLSSYPDGVYILRIVGSATGLEYKIIKK